MILGTFMQFGNFNFFWFLFFFSILGFSQNLEDQIYDATDAFIAKPSISGLEILRNKENQFVSEVNTKEEQLALVILSCNKAFYEKKFNQINNAIKSYEFAWKNYSVNNLANYDIIEYCLKPLAHLYTITGNYTLAENTIKSYLFLAEKEGNSFQKTAAILNLSVVYHNTGNHKMAASILEKELQNKNISTKQRADLENNLAVNYIALKKYDDASSLLTLNKDDYQSIKNKAFISLQKGNSVLARSEFEKAKNLFFQNENNTARDIANFYIDEASLFLKLNNNVLAKQSYTNALKSLLPFLKQNILPEKSNIYGETAFINIFDGLAFLEKSTTRKLAFYDLSFHASSLINENLVSQESQILQQVEDRKRTEKCIDILWKEYEKEKSSLLLKMAFKYAENSKNTVLKERNNQKTLLQRFPNNKDLKLQNVLLSKQESLINEYVRLQITHDNPTKIVKLNDDLTTLSIELKEVNERINKTFKKNEDFSLSLDTLEVKLEKDKAQMLYYFWGKDCFYSFYFNHNKIHWERIALDKKNIDILQKFIHYFDDSNAINNDILAFSSTAFSLFNLLNLEQLEQHKTLVIIPDGILHFISFDALVTHKSETTTFSKIPFLLFQNKMAYQTNAAFYIQNNTSKKNNKIAGFFPVFKNTNAFLEYSIDEAKVLEKNNAVLFMNKNANRMNFKKNTTQYSILHLSTHGTSGSFTTPATLVFYDDVMLVNELYGLENCNPDLVILSACETGVGKLQKGEGSISIARAFQYAGAKNILFSLWKINDYATAEIMTNFYTNYFNNHSFFESNYNSKKDYLQNESISNAKKSPYYWSAFVYYGVIDTPKTSYLYYLLLGLITCIVLFLIYGRFTRFLKRKEIQKN